MLRDLKKINLKATQIIYVVQVKAFNPNQITKCEKILKTKILLFGKSTNYKTEPKGCLVDDI
jgi:hypothetical protein